MTHPYSSLEGSALWSILDALIDDLEKNGDLELRTARQYVVGYLALKLADGGWPVEGTGGFRSLVEGQDLRP